MRGVRTTLAHTGQLDRATLAAAHDLLAVVFDDLEESDWEHCLGGLHALAVEDGQLVGHAALVQRRLLHAGRVLRAGYVEGVAVLEGSRRRGHGAAMMAALEQVARGAYDVAALGSTDEGEALYGARGWVRWRGPTSALTPGGVLRTPDDDGGVWVLPLGAALDVDGELTCDWREGDVW
jgi:aminoglycoside 2'-N-acetyltransferase I